MAAAHEAEADDADLERHKRSIPLCSLRASVQKTVSVFS